MKAQALQPKYDVGTIVKYKDRQGRIQQGAVDSVEGKWFGYKAGPYLQYRLEHPTYRNGAFHCSEDAIIGEGSAS